MVNHSHMQGPAAPLPPLPRTSRLWRTTRTHVNRAYGNVLFGYGRTTCKAHALNERLNAYVQILLHILAREAQRFPDQ